MARRRVPAGASSPERNRRSSASALFLAPAVVVFIGVVLYPMAAALRMSFYDWKILPGAHSEFLGLANYGRALRDETFWRGLVNAAAYMILTVPVQAALGLCVALLLNSKIRMRGAFRAIYYLPVVTSWVVVSLLFQYLFSTDTGLFNWVLKDLTHLSSGNVAWLQHRWTAILAISALGVWKGIGWSMIIFLAALQGVSEELQEAAAIDGARAIQRFRHVTLPAIRRTTSFVAIMLVIGGFNVFISVMLMTGGGPAGQTEVPLTYMYRQAFSFLDFGYGAALSFLLTVVVISVSVAQLRFFQADGDER